MKKKTKSYSMEEGLAVAKIATADITKWLESKSETKVLLNVEDNPFYQNKDIDLILQTDKGIKYIEIKGDRVGDRTGNFFFETVSNLNKMTDGCFLYTQADLLFYYFVNSKELYILPVKRTRKWFLGNQDCFKSKTGTTSVGDDEYSSLGKLVPIKRVLKEVSGAIKYIIGFNSN